MIESLINKSTGSEDRLIKRRLTEEELQHHKTEIPEKVAVLARLKQELKDIASDYRKEIKQVEKELIKTSNLVRAGFQEDLTLCYRVPNFELGIVEFFDEGGDVVDSQPLTPADRQLRIVENNDGE